MEEITLKAKERQITGKKVKQLREKGMLPAVLYGSEAKPENLTIEQREFQKVFAKAGSSALVDLQIDDQSSVKILIHEPQLDPVKDLPIHVDLYKIKMTEKITTEIPLKFVGEAPAVKDLEGNLITNKDAVEVECLPGDLIPEIEVNISGLKTFDDYIYVKDLKLPETIKNLGEPEDIIVQVTPPRSEEELEEMEKEAATEEKEQIEKMEEEAIAEKTEEEVEEAAEEGAEKPAEEEKKPEEAKADKEK